MFVQVIQGKVGDAAGLERQWHRWMEDISPGAVGVLGSTGGITTKGIFVFAARFENETEARKNQGRPEQDAWWAETEKTFDGPVTFFESSDVTVHDPGRDDAGFVQMMRAKVSDRARLEQLEAEMSDRLMAIRPDIIGGYRVWLPDGRVHVVDYFTSEAEARAGETMDYPDDVKATFQEWMGLLSDTEWFDINEPWLHTA